MNGHPETHDQAKFHLQLLVLGIVIVMILNAFPEAFVFKGCRTTLPSQGPVNSEEHRARAAAFVESTQAVCQPLVRADAYLQASMWRW